MTGPCFRCEEDGYLCASCPKIIAVPEIGRKWIYRGVMMCTYECTIECKEPDLHAHVSMCNVRYGVVIGEDVWEGVDSMVPRRKVLTDNQEVEPEVISHMW